MKIDELPKIIYGLLLVSFCCMIYLNIQDEETVYHFNKVFDNVTFQNDNKAFGFPDISILRTILENIFKYI